MTFDPHVTTALDLEREAAEKGHRGYVAVAEADGTAGLRHWTQAGEVNGRWNQNVKGETASVEQRMIARLHEGLPTVVRRSAQERFQKLFEKLVSQAMVSYRKLGYPTWPRSIEAKLRELGFKPNDSDVYAQCRALAARLFIEAGNQQKEQDQKKTALDWHGGYNHALTNTPSLDTPSLSTPVQDGPTSPALVASVVG